MNQPKTKITFCLLLSASFLFISNCNGQKANPYSCKAHFLIARKNLNAYYKTHQLSQLADALKAVDYALACPETRRAAVELKMGLFSLQKQYMAAYEFIGSLSEGDFKYSYKKAMNYNFFRALAVKDKLDTTNRNVYLGKAKNAIETFISKQPTHDDKSNVEPYYDLVLIMKRIGNTQKTNSEINKLKTKYPALKNLLNPLNNKTTSSGSTTKISNAQ